MIKKRIERRVKRYPVRLEVRELNGQPATDTYVVDLSSLGARLEAATPLAPRQTVELTVILADQETATRLSGQVIWMRPLLDSPGRFRMGVKFFSPQWDIDRLAQTGML